MSPLPLIPRPARAGARPADQRAPRVARDTIPTAGPWLVSHFDPWLRPTVEAARSLIAPHCPGLGARILLEPADGAAPASGADARRIRFRLAQAGELPTPAPVLGIDPSGRAWCDEAYRIAVGAEGVTCVARTPRGLMRAAASTAQLLGAGHEADVGEFDDSPRFAWRGLMVDPARSFITTGDLRRLVDLAALYKLNVLHLHLTDNEGWRIEVPGRARLIEAETTGWYSLAEFRDLQRYAAARHVTVVPEVDLPGHCAAATRAYPGLGTAKLPGTLPAEVAAALARPLDPGDAHSRRFIEDVYGALADATDGPYLHIGGDEVFGMAPGPFAEAVRLARAAVRAGGRRPVGWQEAARAGTSPGDISQFWVDTRMADLPRTREGFEARPELAAAGLTLDLVRRLNAHFEPADGDLARGVENGGSILLSPQSHLYLDRPYEPAEVPRDRRYRLRTLGFSNYRPLALGEASRWSPVDHGVEPERIAGVEATLFGATLRSFEDLTLMLLPRLPAVAEAAWSGEPAPWAAYRARLAAHSALWRQRGLSFTEALCVDWC